MVSRFRLAWLIAAIALAACGRDPAAPGSPGAGAGEPIRGNERLGWDQRAANAAELASFRYAIYVDSARSEARDVRCATSAGPAGFACSSLLPPMSPGVHTIELGTFTIVNGAPVESARSAPLRITVIGLTAEGGSSPPGAATQSPGEVPSRASSPQLATRDGLRLSTDVVAEGFEDAIDLALGPDGRVLVAEREGRVWTLQDGTLNARPALLLEDAAIDGRRGGLLAIARDPDFENAPFLYVLHTADGRGGEMVFRLVRFREAGGIFGERAVLLDGVPASADPAGSVRFGPDGKLYVALDDGDDPDGAAGLASPNGKVLRLNADGTTPADQPAANPAISAGHHSPRGFDWQPGSGLLWMADSTPHGSPHLLAVLSNRAAPAGVRRAVHALPVHSATSGAVFHHGGQIAAFAGDLLLGLKEEQGLLRIRFDRENPRRISSTERLFQDHPESIQAVAVAPDGSLYLSTRTALIRVRSSD